MKNAPIPNIEARFRAYAEKLSTALGHADRVEPFQAYCTGLLLPVERKSVEPMAAQLAPGHVSAKHQSLHHFVAKAAWSDGAVMKAVRDYALPKMQNQGPILAWIVDDTGFPKKGKHSVGVARQYCGQLGKQDNCQCAVSVSVATAHASLPVAYRLYVPQEWVEDSARRTRAGIPEEVAFQTKPEIALDQLQRLDQDGYAQRSGARRCRLWQRQRISPGCPQFEALLRAWHSKEHQCVGTGHRTLAST